MAAIALELFLGVGAVLGLGPLAFYLGLGAVLTLVARGWMRDARVRR